MTIVMKDEEEEAKLLISRLMNEAIVHSGGPFGGSLSEAFHVHMITTTF